MINTEAESWVIGGLLNNPESIGRLRLFLSAKDFVDPVHARIFATVAKLYDQGIPLDLTTIYSSLKEEESIMVARYLYEEIPTDRSLEYWGKLVRKQSLQRQLKEVVMDEEIDLKKVEPIIHELSTINNSSDLYRSLDEIPPLTEEPGTRIQTGFVKLDQYVRFGLGHLMVIGGKTGEGKTSLGLGILYHISKERPVGVISIEMTAEEVRERIKNSFDTPPPNFFVADPPALSTLELKHICRTMKVENGVAVVLVDYLQLLREKEDFRSRHLEVSHIIRRIKEIAKELKMAMIVISQLSRDIDYRGEGSSPSLSDLKESGDIEYAADSILFIHQPRKEEKDYRGEDTKFLIIAKNRWGMTGRIQVSWQGFKTRFGSYDKEGNQISDGIDC